MTDPIAAPTNPGSRAAGSHTDGLKATEVLTARVLPWLFAVALTVYLGLSGGGYDIVVRSEVGIVVWWFVLLGVIVGVLPRAGIPRAGWIAVALLTGFLLWTWLGLSWSNSHELTLDEVCRVSTYLGVFLLGVCFIDRDSARSVISGVAVGIVIVTAVAVLSKLSPSLFPSTASKFYETARLGYPFDYADAVGEFAALGLPLLLFLATSGRTLVGRAAAAAGLPIVLFCLALTVSRGGILAAVVGIVAFLALMPDRVPRLPTLVLAGAGIALLMGALLQRPALRDSIGVAPASDRHSMLAILCVIVVLTGIVQALLVLLMRRTTRPGWLNVSRRGAHLITAGIVGVVAVILVIAAASGLIHNLWHDFKQANPTAHSNQYFRLLSLAGSHRYQYWQVAIKAFKSAPLIGIGPGTFRFYWAAHQTLGEYVLNAHSLWVETLAETGLIGFLLIGGFFGYLVIGGARRSLRASSDVRVLVATATAMVAGFCAAAAFDWVWQMGVIPMITLLVAAVIVADLGEPVASAASGPQTTASKRRLTTTRVLLGSAAIIAIALIAIPLASTVAVRSSQAAAARGQLTQALADANSAQQLQPGAASPRLQRALLLEQLGDVSGAEQAITEAIQREPDNSQLWLVASRIATELGHAKQALADWQRAKSLDPTSVIFR
jgi:hypothetical protein